uniref:Uncharacterized protein n=1 Tax=Cacopsylla melanoneura TaxID=428564 RepID=A0A8D8YKF9_9HEMI
MIPPVIGWDYSTKWTIKGMLKGVSMTCGLPQPSTSVGTLRNFRFHRDSLCEKPQGNDPVPSSLHKAQENVLKNSTKQHFTSYAPAEKYVRGYTQTKERIVIVYTHNKKN